MSQEEEKKGSEPIIKQQPQESGEKALNILLVGTTGTGSIKPAGIPIGNVIVIGWGVSSRFNSLIYSFSVLIKFRVTSGFGK